MPSTKRLSTLATSCTDSRVPMPISLSVMNSELPPSWRMATSKLTRVRRLGLAKTQASTPVGMAVRQRVLARQRLLLAGPDPGSRAAPRGVNWSMARKSFLLACHPASWIASGSIPCRSAAPRA